jgi:type III polyketide synthase
MVEASREGLAEGGNLASVAVLDVLARTFQRHRPSSGSRGLVAAFGPGFTVEMAIGIWQGDD